MLALNVQNLSCQRGYNRLFEELSFTANSGDLLRITGINGSGKTSLLKILAGLSDSQKGQIMLGENLVKSPKYQQEVFYLGHLSALSGQLNCLENLEFLTGLNSATASPLLLEALDKIGLKGYQNEYCSKLSAGQKRRVILAGLFASKAKIWLLDEPFTALDRDGISLVEACIKTHCQQGGICIFTTHQASNLPNQKTLAL
ncbi:MAG: cytochrome c biogenesis heme-transporting ATPase CcmA [Candidatus Thioglobus sp.]|nr:cytochrome c biogenesis heme-transporting ATPase CcmA [Candidatus Thioglobus sp.]